jgi:hypothetical protein
MQAMTVEPSRTLAEPTRDHPTTDAEREQREDRYHRRYAAVMADKNIDPKLRALYLSRDLWTKPQVGAALKVDPARIWRLRNPAAETGPGRHPAKLPAPVEWEKTSKGQYEPLYESGEIWEWAVQAGQQKWDPRTRTLKRSENGFTGAGRAREVSAPVPSPRRRTNPSK